MKIKHVLLIPGVLLLSLSCLPVLPSFAQTESAPAVQPQRKGNRLNLTEQQKAEMQRIRQETQAEIENVLNEQQKAQFRQMKSEMGQQSENRPGKRANFKQGMASLNLTQDQKNQIRAIRQKAQQRIQAILTEEQRTLMQQRRAQKQGRRQQRPQQPGQPSL
jgi:Spy/CpxP family protein refolding chaperone